MLRVIRDTIQDACDEQINEHLNEQINEHQQRLVSILGESPTLTIANLASQAGCSVATVRRDLSYLQRFDIIRREGSRKTGSWVVA